MSTKNRPLKVFLCHARADRDSVRNLYNRLTKDGVDAWLDDDMLPGQDRELEIRKAVQEADVVVVCLSKKFNQEGVQHREIKLALDTAMEIPEGEIFIIPARLKECDIPVNLRRFHQVDLFEEDGYKRLILALRARANKIGADLASTLTTNDAKNQTRIKIVAFFAIITLIIAAIILLKKNPSTPSINSSPTPTLTSVPTFTPTATFTLTPTFTPTPYVCPYQGQTDNETISSLIQAEAAASNTKDFSTIQSIFDPNAIFYDYASKPAKQWFGPTARYKDDLFKTTDLQGVEHFDISPVGPGINGDTAYYISGSKGNYRIGGGNWTVFFNGSLTSTSPTQFGSEHWILKKDNLGCWVITQMEFNAGHIKFPTLP